MKSRIWKMPVLVLSLFGVVSLTSHFAEAAKFDCDGLMMGLMRQNGGCPSGTCKYNIVNGQLTPANGGVVSKDDGSTEMKSVTSATKDSNGVSAVKIESGKDGDYRMSLSVVDEKGRTTKSEYGLAAKDGSCVHDQTERKNPTDLAMGVEYDREFCSAAASAYEGLSPDQAKTCDDLLTNLVGKYEERANALAKNRKAFSSANFSETVNAKMLANNGAAKAGQAKLIQALKQKDQCAKASTEVEHARPLSNKAYLERLFAPDLRGEVYIKDNRAYPLKDFGRKTRGTKN